MSDKTKIEWTDATWNPVRGCSMVSAGCTNCYAMGVASRFGGRGLPYEGLTIKTTQGAKWSGNIMLVPGALAQPLKWRRPRKIFVNSMSDLFHEGVPDSYIDQVFAVMALAPRHTFQVLTKRPERMRDYCQAFSWARVAASCRGADGVSTIEGHTLQALMHHFGQCPSSTLNFARRDVWPLPNVWLGVSVEDQVAADVRIPALLDTPAALRFLSVEPLLGPVNFAKVPGFNRIGLDLRHWWVIVGGESGSGARPMHPAWARNLRDQCTAAGVPFLFKQWGEFHPACDHDPKSHANDLETLAIHADGRTEYRPLEVFGSIGEPGWEVMCRVGKRAAGRLLDGVEHNGFPEVA